MSRSLLVVSGLTRESRLAKGSRTITVAGGGSRRHLEEQFDRLDGSRLSGVVSFGLAGALDQSVRVGDLLVGRGVVDDGTRHEAGLADALVALGASSSLPPDASPASHRTPDVARPKSAWPVRTVEFAGSDVPLLTIADKDALRERTAADAVDMESHVAAAYAARLGVPFGIIRAVSDRADQVLPAVTGRAMRPDGSIDIGAVLAGLMRDPRQIAALIRTARDAEIAFRRLRRVGRLLGLGGGLLGLDL